MITVEDSLQGLLGFGRGQNGDQTEGQNGGQTEGQNGGLAGAQPREPERVRQLERPRPARERIC